MNERDELLAKFNTAMPLVNELNSLENKSIKCITLTKAIAFFTFMVVFVFVVCISVDYLGKFGGFIKGGFPFYVALGIMIWLYTVNKKKVKATDDAITKIINSDELSFIPFSYRNSVNIVGIYMVLVNMRADTFKEAINVWEQDKHNMVMEAKPTVIVKYYSKMRHLHTSFL